MKNTQLRQGDGCHTCWGFGIRQITLGVAGEIFPITPDEAGDPPPWEACPECGGTPVEGS